MSWWRQTFVEKNIKNEATGHAWQRRRALQQQQQHKHFGNWNSHHCFSFFLASQRCRDIKLGLSRGQRCHEFMSRHRNWRYCRWRAICYSCQLLGKEYIVAKGSQVSSARHRFAVTQIRGMRSLRTVIRQMNFVFTYQLISVKVTRILAWGIIGAELAYTQFFTETGKN